MQLDDRNVGRSICYAWFVDRVMMDVPPLALSQAAHPLHACVGRRVHNVLGAEQEYTPPPPLPPATPRWGRGMGCDFVLKSAKDWPDRYLCKARREEGCTFDNRRPAVCDLTSPVVPPSFQFQVWVMWSAGARAFCCTFCARNCKTKCGCGRQ